MNYDLTTFLYIISGFVLCFIAALTSDVVYHLFTSMQKKHDENKGDKK